MQIQIPSHIPPHLAHVVRTYISGRRVDADDAEFETKVDCKIKGQINASIVERVVESMGKNWFSPRDIRVETDGEISTNNATNHLFAMQRAGKLKYKKNGKYHYFRKVTKAQVQQ